MGARRLRPRLKRRFAHHAMVGRTEEMAAEFKQIVALEGTPRHAQFAARLLSRTIEDILGALGASSVSQAD